MHRSITRTVALFATLISASASAEYVSPHGCDEPFEDPFPSAFSDTTFQIALQNYKECIEDYVQEQEDAIRAHRDAAEEAVDEWNDYVARMSR